ncbi:pyridoxine 5'-phosphate synthase [bacterium]|jgi:pyridoxine 5-phosphate synthase|nr:pyridoxine 5'-phosphate synthase [bacterium]
MNPTGLPTLGVNIDHVATLRQLRGTPYPNLLEAARMVEVAGAQQITVHLREDRRHIQPEDVILLRKQLKIALNLEMANTDAMVKFAIKHKPDWVCLVPEKRQEVTTEGGLDIKKNKKQIGATVAKLRKAKIQVSLFIEPTESAVEISRELGADAVELHTGRYCIATQKKASKTLSKESLAELERIRASGTKALNLGLKAHAGHGFDFENVRPVAALLDSERKPLIREYNIGHAIVCRAVLVGLERAVREMLSAILAP